jgi:hypothetical protein
MRFSSAQARTRSKSYAKEFILILAVYDAPGEIAPLVYILI